MDKNWRHKQVKTIFRTNTVVKPIPSGWQGEVISQSKAMNGKTLLTVVWEPTGEEITVFEHEIEEA